MFFDTFSFLVSLLNPVEVVGKPFEIAVFLDESTFSSTSISELGDKKFCGRFCLHRVVNDTVATFQNNILCIKASQSLGFVMSWDGKESSFLLRTSDDDSDRT